MTAAARRTRIPAGRRGRAGDRLTRIVGGVVVTIVSIALLAPAVLVAVLSFSGDSYLTFPPKSWGLRQYQTMFTDPTWGSAIGLSFKIALPTAIISALIAVPAVIAIHRSQLPGRNSVQVAGLTGIIIPISAYAVAMYAVQAQFHILGTYLGLLVANITIAMPLVLVVTAAAMSRIPISLEQAAMTAGASRGRALAGITVRLLAPAILAGSVLAFITSFDEAVFINFLGGPGQVTLPKAIFDSVRFGLDPVITAIATVLMVATSLLMLVALRLGRKGR
ncbi:MAG: putative spermidine/putrescine transport system permease protein [Solirubrobacteraceae bacterium]|jgi:ABC-type spermidine/putrescine transport system permease subunit II|nr:putative spermidine/putrescine transport system permease protein [Solirubrobacteraceae bacterium]MEA2395566.1 putative spermidine/putrescine transport system permease protein [Solirubrobacteraceae bacterium]